MPAHGALAMLCLLAVSRLSLVFVKLMKLSFSLGDRYRRSHSQEQTYLVLWSAGHFTAWHEIAWYLPPFDLRLLVAGVTFCRFLQESRSDRK